MPSIFAADLNGGRRRGGAERTRARFFNGPLGLCIGQPVEELRAQPPEGLFIEATARRILGPGAESVVGILAAYLGDQARHGEGERGVLVFESGPHLRRLHIGG